MSENKWISAYKKRVENLNRTLQECVLKNSADGILNLNETLFILRGAVQEIESQHKEIIELKQITLNLKNTIKEDMDKLEEYVS